MSEHLTCQVCSEPKASLERIPSRLVTGWELNICQSCKAKKHEPRFIIVLAINQFGRTPLIDEYVRKRLYPGEEILLREAL